MDATAGLREYRRRAATAAAAGVVSFLVVVFLTDRFGAMADAVTAFGAMGFALGAEGLMSECVKPDWPHRAHLIWPHASHRPDYAIIGEWITPGT
jgi:hypothetical protein